MLTDIKSVAFIWDSNERPVETDKTIVLWQNYSKNSPKIYSIPKLVEEDALNLRARYLRWIYSLGEAIIKGKRLVDHLQIRPGFSYWWMTLIILKTNLISSSRVVDVIKMMAFENLASTLSLNKIIVVTNDKKLALAFKKWCKDKNLDYEWRKPSRQKASTPFLRKIYSLTPHIFKAAFLLLRHILMIRPLCNAGIEKKTKFNARISFFGYFFNLSEETLLGDRFKTKYWTMLHDVLEQNNLSVNWFHIFIKNSSAHSASDAGKIIKHLNQNRDGKECHTFIDSGLSYRAILKSIQDYYRIMLMGLRLKNCIEHFSKLIYSDIDLWPFIEDDWNNSMYGSTAMKNCLDLVLFESLMKKVRLQKIGFYLQENQAWETALIYAWKASGHGRLIGVPHATVRFWDLRYFYDPDTYKQTGKNDIPLPDKVALNGPVALKSYKDAGYPIDSIVEVEALRYLYLEKFKFGQSDKKNMGKKELRVLVLGDYSQYETSLQMNILNNAISFMSKTIYFVVKPHPACPIDPKNYPNLKLNISNDPLELLLNDCDMAYTSSTTSAAVDAYCAGIPIISFLDQSKLNLSPLLGLTGVLYVCTPEELSNALDLSISSSSVLSSSQTTYFTLDCRIPRWKKILIEEI